MRQKQGLQKCVLVRYFFLYRKTFFASSFRSKYFNCLSVNPFRVRYILLPTHGTTLVVKQNQQPSKTNIQHNKRLSFLRLQVSLSPSLHSIASIIATIDLVHSVILSSIIHPIQAVSSFTTPHTHTDGRNHSHFRE